MAPGRAERRGGNTAREEQLATALRAVRDRLAAAAAATGRDPGDVELLPVTKFFPASDVEILARLGCRAVGESRDQEAAAKIAELAGRVPEPLRWHMIGSVQRNKANSVARWAFAVHSVDSPRLVGALGRAADRALAAGERSAPLQIYVQLSLDGDPARGGVDIADPAAVDALCAEVAGQPALRLAGVMGIPPVGADPDEAFAALAAARQRIAGDHPGATGLSAGMSADLESAVRHGSTVVRVGTALMGQRPLRSPSVVTPVTSLSPSFTPKGHR
ncbi:YggS family pyridoxal phosphate-dependent enzyme [Mycobacterium sp. MYCO198283]|uniref:YggS family pyridoxal phosphate-dependent enzyme n=1 Tax=Mycobacterium sp. MYCO198283 TaxID=2883505 RepID=UPI001E639BCB|nr:YggS family pyridoxal phosphate-dependent enzyme [Mycobacterium sp. MYCO198283]MCG5432736.1 YggS family pyridoxal phosphate-dependent enzyme [Mycobacterium sp. MYCO198283]